MSASDRRERRQVAKMVRIVYGPKHPVLSCGCLVAVALLSGALAGLIALAALGLWRLVA